MGRREDSTSVGCNQANAPNTVHDNKSHGNARTKNHSKESLNKSLGSVGNANHIPQITNVVQRSGAKKHTLSQISAPQIISNTIKAPSKVASEEDASRLVSGQGAIANPGDYSTKYGAHREPKSTSVVSKMSGVETRNHNSSTLGSSNNEMSAGRLAHNSKSNSQKETK